MHPSQTSLVHSLLNRRKKATRLFELGIAVTEIPAYDDVALAAADDATRVILQLEHACRGWRVAASSRGDWRGPSSLVGLRYSSRGLRIGRVEVLVNKSRCRGNGRGNHRLLVRGRSRRGRRALTENRHVAGRSVRRRRRRGRRETGLGRRGWIKQGLDPSHGNRPVSTAS